MSTSTPDPTGSVVLCGSVTRAVAALDAAEAYYLAQGYTVHKPVADDSRTPEEHAERWYTLIDACGPDDVVVICSEPDQPFGKQTLREWNYALERSKQIRHWIEGKKRSAMPTPELAVSPVDTAALPDYADTREMRETWSDNARTLWSAIDWTLWGHGLNDVAREPIATAMVQAIPAAEIDRLVPVMLAWRERRGWPVLHEEYAKLRDQIQRLTAERDKFADLHRGEARTHDETIASLNAARDEVARLETLVLEKSQAADDWRNAAIAERDGALARAAAARAVVASRPAIPDDAAVRGVLATWVEAKATEYSETSKSLWNDGKRTKAKWYGSTAGSLLADASNIRAGHTALADLGLSAPATDPAPAAADEVPGLDALHLYAALEKPDGWLYRRFLDSFEEPLNRDSVESAADTAGSDVYRYLRLVRAGELVRPTIADPASPQAPAEPTKCKETGGSVQSGAEIEGSEPSGQAPAETTGKWNEGDVAYDSTGFVHVRYAQGWRTYPRTTGTQYGDDAMEAHLGPLVRLDAVPAGTSDTGVLPHGFVHRPAAREDTAPPATAEHHVIVDNLPGGWSEARCLGCPETTEGSDDEVEDWADAHRADTLQSGRLTPIRPTTED